MTIHYLKIALRNMRKFKLQTIVCLIGLAVGMTCFALGTLWLRFIESFEDFVPDADNVFLVMDGEGKTAFNSGYYYCTQNEEGDGLQKNMPGLTEHCHLIFTPQFPNNNIYQLTAEGQSFKAVTAFADSAYVRMFGIEAEEGSLAHLRDGEMALTRSAACKLFGNKSALGKSVEMVIPAYGREPFKQTFSVVAIIADCPPNSQFGYEVLAYCEEKEHPTPLNNSTLIFITACTFVKFAPSVPRDSIVGKRDVEMLLSDGGKHTKTYTFAPLTKVRSDFPGSDIKISTSYVRWFMALGLLVIFCSLVNYLITMVNHLRRRGWEMSLRRVLGSSRVHILYMVSLETLLIFLLATLLTCALTALLLPYFREYSGIAIAWSAIAQRLVAYLALVIACGMALASLTAWVVMCRTQGNILASRQLKHSSNMLDRAGVCLQMALSMGIIFCAVVMLRQLYMVMYSNELGFTHADMGVVYAIPEELKIKIQQSPLTAESHACDKAMYPRRSYVSGGGCTKNEKDIEDRDTYVWCQDEGIHKDMFDFYHMEMVCGELPVHDKYKDLYREEYVDAIYNGEKIKALSTHNVIEVVINETYCHALSWTPENAIGQSLWNIHTEYRISGVIKDVYFTGPTSTPDAIIYTPMREWNGFDLVFRSQPGRIAELCDSIRQWINQLDEAEAGKTEVINCEEDFEQYVSSEQMLIKILFAVGGASLFVCVIGTFSLVSLSLQQRRKEIAIRKVYGAKLGDIQRLFLRSQVISLVVAAAIAYPISYIIMNHWLEGYQKQVGIDWWIIPATFIAIAAVVIATISVKIWRSALECTVTHLAA